METLFEKRFRIIDETIAAYTTKTRSVNEIGKCQYFTEGTIGCAVGRLIEDKELCKKLDTETMTSLYSIFNLLPEEIQELGESFLGGLQNLHDRNSNWDENGITLVGLQEAESLKFYYCKNQFFRFI